MLKLISNEVEPFVPKDQRDMPNPTVFGVVRMGKGQSDRLMTQVERGVRKLGGKQWESVKVDKFQRAIWKNVKWIKNIARADGVVAEIIDDPKELMDIYDVFPTQAAAEVIGYINCISALDEDEEGNSGSVPDSAVSGDTTASSGAPTSATTAVSTD
jgi:hypothetical protein